MTISAMAAGQSRSYLWSPLTLGFCAMALPTIYTLATETWGQEDAAHGPLIICSGLWLLWRQLPEFTSAEAQGEPWIVALALAISLPIYIFGEGFDFVTLAAMGLYATGVTILYSASGIKVIARNWFIFVYLLFAVPPPRSWLDSITFPLKQFASSAATVMLQPLGIPVAHEGVVIYVAQYQYLVEDACSGLNSIVGLLAIGLLYIHLVRRGSWRYSLLLAGLTIPIAILANILRIAILILLTVFLGDAVAQGYMHFAAGIVVFALALLLIMSMDFLFVLVRSWRHKTI